MRIVWVKVGGLWPLNTGGRLRSFHLIQELARRHRVTLVTTHGPGDDPDGLAARLPRCEVISFPYLIPKLGSVRFVLALLRSWLSPLPVDLLKYRVPAVAREVRWRIERSQVDACVADFLSATVNVPFGGPVPVVFFAHNVEHMIWKRLGAVEKQTWRRALLAIEWRKLRRAEARVCRRAAQTLAVSDVDGALLAAGAPGVDVRVVPTGVDTSYFSPRPDPPARASMVFTGSMDWHPNEDAVLYFMEAILPRIREALPEVSFSVVGRNPTPRLLAAAASAGARVTGTVDDVRPYLAEGAVFVVPLRVGGGTRLKIFEALAMGKAVVSTRVGAEGLPLVAGKHFLEADDPEDFARAVVSLLRDPGRRDALGRAGRALVEERYSWPQVAARFEALCEEVGARPSARSSSSTRGILRKVKRALPARFVNHVRALLYLTPREQQIYWKAALGRPLQRPEPVRRIDPAAVRSVLFVCHGNMIRSPMAAALLDLRLAGGAGRSLSVSSAGLHAVHGRGADPRALKVAREFGICLAEHRARPLTERLVAEADLIITMDSLNEAELLARYPASREKLFPIGRGGKNAPVEVMDPYDGDEDDIRRCFRLLRHLISPLARTLALPGEDGGGADSPVGREATSTVDIPAPP